MSAGIGIVASVVPLVGKIWLVVVLETVNPVVVVQVNAKEKFRPVDLIPEKGLVVIGDTIADCPIVILVEIAYEVVVFVPAGENRKIGTRLTASLPIGSAILIVVVFDELVEKLGRLVVVDIAILVE